MFGIDFDNPVGLAAGFDKDGEALANLSKLGFGFVEAGSTTPLPQPGNPYPRVFRLVSDMAVINRYGFNNLGHDQMMDNLERQAKQLRSQNTIVGINLGKNKYQTDNSADYIAGLRRFYHSDVVSYFVVNISSPNTPNLRNLQQKDSLSSLLDDVLKEKFSLEKQSDSSSSKPLLIKLAPDLSDDELKEIAAVITFFSKPTSTRSKVDGLIISNTTIQRPADMKSKPELIQQPGGLSGRPLKHISTEVIRKMYKLTKGSVPIIGCGGIENGQDAFDKIRAGASLVQFYTSMAYYVRCFNYFEYCFNLFLCKQGPQTVREIKYELAYILGSLGYKNVSQAVGQDHRDSLASEDVKRKS